jgi:hypothetical protein
VTPAGTLEQIANLIATLPDESVEGMLVFFDSLVAAADPAGRAAAAEILRNVAASCSDPARRNRLIGAAAAVEAGQPSASAASLPDGTLGVTQEEFDARIAASPLPPLPGEDTAETDDEDEEDDEEEETPYMEAEPPALPHLAVRHFFPGLVVRIGRDFADAYGECCCSSDLYKLEECEADAAGWSLECAERSVRLRAAEHAAIIENAENAWFQPVPTPSCIRAVLEAIDNSFHALDEDAFDDDIGEKAAVLWDDINNCRRWLSRSGGQGRAPKYRKAAVAETIFGPDHELTAWIPWLFAAVIVCLPES